MAGPKKRAAYKAQPSERPEPCPLPGGRRSKFATPRSVQRGGLRRVSVAALTAEPGLSASDEGTNDELAISSKQGHPARNRNLFSRLFAHTARFSWSGGSKVTEKRLAFLRTSKRLSRSKFGVFDASTFEMSPHTAICSWWLASGRRQPDADVEAQATIRPFCRASNAYSDNVFVGRKWRSISRRRPNRVRAAASSERST